MWQGLGARANQASATPWQRSRSATRLDRVLGHRSPCGLELTVHRQCRGCGTGTTPALQLCSGSGLRPSPTHGCVVPPKNTACTPWSWPLRLAMAALLFHKVSFHETQAQPWQCVQADFPDTRRQLSRNAATPCIDQANISASNGRTFSGCRPVSVCVDGDRGDRHRACGRQRDRHRIGRAAAAAAPAEESHRLGCAGRRGRARGAHRGRGVAAAHSRAAGRGRGAAAVDRVETAAARRLERLGRKPCTCGHRLLERDAHGDHCRRTDGPGQRARGGRRVARQPAAGGAGPRHQRADRDVGQHAGAQGGRALSGRGLPGFGRVGVDRRHDDAQREGVQRLVARAGSSAADALP